MKGILTLIPTPIDEENQLDVKSFKLLDDAIKDLEKNIIAVEDHKPARQRWLRFGLDREAISEFRLYNEHTRKEELPLLIKELKAGKNVYLMSDGGMPAFCDPGQRLVDECHKNRIKVTSSPVPNSVILAIALSGFQSDQFLFMGFLPQKADERKAFITKAFNEKKMVVLMDTPYRLEKMVRELSEHCPKESLNRTIFIGMDLNSEQELLLRGSIQELNALVKGRKSEFILIISPH